MVQYNFSCWAMLVPFHVGQIAWLKNEGRFPSFFYFGPFIFIQYKIL